MSRAPIVLLHGAGGCAASFSPLSSAWNVPAPVAIDLPGRGASKVPAARTVNNTWSAIVDQVPQGAVLVGHSYGGAVALRAALRHPERLSGIVLVASGARLKVAPAILAAVAALPAPGDFRLDFAFGASTPESTKTAYHRSISDTPTATVLADWQACDGFDLRARLGEITVPVLVVHGSADPLTPPKFQAWLAEQLPSADRVELPGVGHMVPWEAPDELARVVTAWMSRQA